MDDSVNHVPKQLVPYLWKKGVSANPKGRPKGKTLKEFAKEYLMTLPDEEKVDYLASLPPEIVWKMAEGNPENKTDITTQGEKININDPRLVEIANEFEAKLKKENASRPNINSQLDTE